MTARAGVQLVEIIMPLLQAVIPRCVRPATGEDPEELVQDGLAIAAKMLDAAEAAGQPLRPRSVAYYVLQRLKSGRRSGYAGQRDALCPAAEVRRLVERETLDAEIGAADDNGRMTLHDVLASQTEDPATAACRAADWSGLSETLDARQQDLVQATAEGISRTTVAHKYRVSPARITGIAHELADRIRAAWGQDILAVIATEPSWKSGVRAVHERYACRAERRISV